MLVYYMYKILMFSDKIFHDITNSHIVNIRRNRLDETIPSNVTT